MSELTSLDRLLPHFDGFLVDQFGVLLTAEGAYPGAQESLERLSAYGKRVILLSNSGKRSEPNIDRLLMLGFKRESFLTVLSSGEVAFAILRRRIGVDLPARPTALLLARDHDRSAIAGLDIVLTTDAGAADMVLIAGSESDRIEFDAIVEGLRPAAMRGVPALCSNPDLVMLTAIGPRPGAGALAKAYERMGGSVDYIGKPYPAIYAEASRLLSPIEPKRILCIGDSPAHDIAGGRTAGFATALVRTGIHAAISDDALAALAQAEGAVPDFIIPRFQLAAA